MVKVNKLQILSLYRKILRKGKTQLKFTDKDYFKRRMRLEFSTKPTSFNEEMRTKMYEVRKKNIFFKHHRRKV